VVKVEELLKFGRFFALPKRDEIVAYI